MSDRRRNDSGRQYGQNDDYQRNAEPSGQDPYANYDPTAYYSQDGGTGYQQQGAEGQQDYYNSNSGGYEDRKSGGPVRSSRTDREYDSNDKRETGGRYGGSRETGGRDGGGYGGDYNSGGSSGRDNYGGGASGGRDNYGGSGGRDYNDRGGRDYNSGGSGRDAGGYGNRGGDRSYGGDQSGGGDYGSSAGGAGGPKKSPDTVYISNLSTDVTEENLAELFGSIGIIKMDRKTGGQKIWIYKDKATGIPKGDATVTYDDPPASDAAVEWFDGKEFLGQKIKVEKANAQEYTPKPGRGRGGGGGGGGGRGGGRGGRGGRRGDPY